MYGNDENFNHDEESKRKKAIQARVRRNIRRGLEFEEEMFEERSRYQMLFLTLNYQRECREDITLKTIQAHRDRFIDHMESNPLLKGIDGYIWRLEEGGSGGGFHIHFLIFYSAEIGGDVLVAKMIGDYWMRVITQGWGAYWNSNARKERMEKRYGVGIGQVNRNNDPKRVSLRLFIEAYMAKATQAPLDRQNQDRLFGCGKFSRKRRRC